MRIAISSGDPGGIGPEIVLKALANNELTEHEFGIFGNKRVFERMEKKFELKLPENAKLIEVTSDGTLPELGECNRCGGVISFRSLEMAAQAVNTSDYDALVTAPINKFAWHKAGIDYMGHTDYLASIFNSKKHAMAFYNKPYKLLLQTIHLPLKKIFYHIDRDSILDKIEQCHEFSKILGNSNLPINVIALNPHAGENGRLGNEEKEIQLAIDMAMAKSIPCNGPLVPDAFFARWAENSGGVVLAMYHDQGLIPFKLLSRNRGVNITLGLPIIRTSPEHGTAMNIAKKNTADPQSMIQAIKVAIKLKNSGFWDK